jgi:hypothetical protein
MDETFLFDCSILYIQTLYFLIPNVITSYLTTNTTLQFLMYLPTFIYSYLNSMSRINKLIFIKNLKYNTNLYSNQNNEKKIPETYEVLYFWLYLQFSYILISIFSIFLLFPLVFILNVISSSFLISNYIHSLKWGGFISNGLFISSLEKYPLYSLCGALLIEGFSTFIPFLLCEIFPIQNNNLYYYLYYLFYALFLMQWIRWAENLESFFHQYNKNIQNYILIFKFLDIFINPIVDSIGFIVLFIMNNRKKFKKINQ